MIDRSVWKEEYATGIPVIDEQHQKFFQLIGIAESLFSYKKLEPADVLEIIHLLGVYASYHFETEEKYFSEFSYPHTAEHLALHDAFRKRTADFADRSQRQGTDLRELALEVASFTNDWFIHHILAEDKQYVACFKEHGL